MIKCGLKLDAQWSRHLFLLPVDRVAIARLRRRGGYGLKARNVAMWLVWEQCGMSLREIGDFFGGLNYSTVAQRLRRLPPEDKQEGARLLSKCQKRDPATRPRQLGIEYEGAIYHLLSRGDRREDIFWDDIDRRSLLQFSRKPAPALAGTG
jgi:hypothetical protein